MTGKIQPVERIRASLIYDAPFFLMVAAFVILSVLSVKLFGYPESPDLMVSWNVVAMWAGLYGTAKILAFLVYGKLAKGYSLFQGATWRRAAVHLLDPTRLTSLILIVGILPYFMAAFVSFKGSIPDINPYSWDVRFMDWDRVIHFGVPPWKILQPVLGRPAITQAIDEGYYLWFPILWMTVIWQAWHGERNSTTRSQFLVAFAACWIFLGIVAATLFSSAGPVYFEAVTGVAGPYAPLLDYLQVVNAQDSLSALYAHDFLWQAYSNPGLSHAEGISAMPSLHVSMAVLLSLLGFKTNRWLGWAYSAFAVLIFVGSIHLAWHYAVDGYAAAIGTLLIWWLSGKLVRRWHGMIRSTPQTQDAHV